MTEQWNANIEALKKWNEDMNAIGEALQEAKIPDDAVTAGIEMIADRKVLFAVKDDIAYQLDSLYDSDYYVDTWFSGLKNLRFQSKFILFGMGNGMYVRKILQEAAKDVTILIYEPSLLLFRKVLEEFDLKDIFQDERIIIVVKDVTPLSFGEVVSAFIQYEDMSGLIDYDYPNYAGLFPEEYEMFKKEIRMAYMDEEAEAMLWDLHGKIYYQNTKANVKYLYQSKDLRSLWKAIPKTLPAIVVSSGPSLDKNIEELKKAKGKCFLIAADSALKPLLSHDIIPDLFVSIDGKKSSLHFTDERVRKIPLVCTLQSQKLLLRQHEAENFFMRGIDVYIQKFMEDNQILLPALNSGGSVANDCFELARVLGLTTIILVGQDLAYTDRKTHSAESVRGSFNIDTDTLQTVEIEGIDGNPVLSAYEFQIYLHWFERRISKFPTLKVIDATEGGAKIHGALLETLQQAVREECTQEYDMETCIHEAEFLLTGQQQEALRDYMEQVPVELQKAITLIKQILRDYDKVLELVHLNQYRTKECLYLLRKVSEVTGQLDEMAVMEYVQNHIQEETTKMLNQVYDIEKDPRKEIIETCRLGKNFMQKMLQEAEIILQDNLAD